MGLSQKEALAECILSIASGNCAHLSDVDVRRRLRDALLGFGSETPDNLNCVDSVEFGVVQRRHRLEGTIRSLRLVGTTVAVSDVLNALEDIDTPAALQELYPEITPEHWSAMTRLATLLSLLFEDHPTKH